MTGFYYKNSGFVKNLNVEKLKKNIYILPYKELTYMQKLQVRVFHAPGGSNGVWKTLT